MNEENPINTGITEDRPPEQQTHQIKQSIVSNILAKIPPRVKSAFNRFYANKKAFWIITILLCLIFLTITIGVLFGSPKRPSTLNPKKTPQPQIQKTPEPSPDEDVLSVIESELKDLGHQINALDTAQNKLKPPVVNYEISF